MFLLDWPQLTVTPTWTRTLDNEFIRPAFPKRIGTGPLCVPTSGCHPPGNRRIPLTRRHRDCIGGQKMAQNVATSRSTSRRAQRGTKSVNSARNACVLSPEETVACWGTTLDPAHC